jgi:hypothetical protein
VVEKERSELSVVREVRKAAQKISRECLAKQLSRRTINVGSRLPRSVSEADGASAMIASNRVGDKGCQESPAVLTYRNAGARI